MLNRINFRDFGGVPAGDGRRIRTGLLYRSGILQKLNASDTKQIESHKIRYAVDLRSTLETEKDPVTLPALERVALPCNIDRITRDRLRPLLFRRKADEQIMAVIEGVYIEMVELMKGPMDQLVRLMISPGGLPVLMHCRAGKDRTGFAVALIQGLLGVSREEILKEYLRSNDFMMPHLSKTLRRIRLFTIGILPKGNLQAAFEVKERYLNAALDTVERDYGSIGNYLMQGGLTPQDLEKLKDLLLEP